MSFATRRPTGFTLIEAIVALTIVVAVTAVAIPAVIRTADRAKLNGATRELVVALKSVRHEARASGRESLFTLDVDSHVYSVAGRDRSLAMPREATLALLTAESERLAATAGAIRFFADGSSTGGTVTVTHGSRSARIEVDWLTGHVRAVRP